MDTLKKTPLYDVHIALGGKMVDFGGWALPVQYSSILEEHKAVRERCGLFDVSHMGELWVSGEGAFPYLQYMLTNDITTMTPGRCRYSMVCYEDGGTVDDVLVYKYSDTDYLVVVNASNTEKDFEWFAAHAIPTVQVENKSAEYAMHRIPHRLYGRGWRGALLRRKGRPRAARGADGSRQVRKHAALRPRRTGYASV